MRIKKQVIVPTISMVAVLFITASHSMIISTLTNLSDAINTFINAEGNQSQIETGAFGEVVVSTDSAGLTSNIERDLNGNPTSSTLPDGSVINQTFDVSGNTTSHTERTLGGTTSTRYDAQFSQITQVTDALFATTNVFYDGAGNPIQLTTPEGRSTTATYQAFGLVSTLTDTLGTVTNVTYDANQQPLQLVAGLGTSQRQAQRTYTAAGYVDSHTDSEGRVFDLDYDLMGRVTQVTLPDNRTINYDYDLTSNLTSLTPPGRSAYTFNYNEVGLLSASIFPTVANGGSNQTTYSYNANRQATLFVRADSAVVDLGYDTAGRLATISQPDGDFTLSYSVATGLLESIVSPDGVTLSNTYNNELLTQVTWSGLVSGSIGYTYDAKGRITTFTNAGRNYTYAFNNDDDVTRAGAQTLSYDASSGLLTSTTLDTIIESFSYNEFAELTQHTVTSGVTTIYDVAYSHDGLGRIIQQIETIQGTTTTTDYSYDLAGRVETVTADSTLVATYSYDSNDNRTDHGGVYDAQDRIMAQTGITYGYNAHGERTQKTGGSQSSTYQYNALGDLVGVRLANGDQINYLLDGQRRRVAKQLNGVTIEAWLYSDNLEPVARLNATNAITQRYVYGANAHVPDYIDLGLNRYKIIADHLGSVRLVVDSSDGSILQRLNYDAWGNITNDTSPNFQPFAYAGGINDNDSRLTHFGSREYDAESSHWTSKDPSLFRGSSKNLYVYVDADPLNMIDSDGLEPRRPRTTSPTQRSVRRRVRNLNNPQPDENQVCEVTSEIDLEELQTRMTPASNLNSASQFFRDRGDSRPRKRYRMERNSPKADVGGRQYVLMGLEYYLGNR